MPSYKILSEFSSEAEPDSISVAPFWVVAVVRFRQPLTFSRKKLLAGESDTSFNKDFDSLIRERSMLVLSDDIVNMSVSHSKDSYVSGLTATLVGSELNYLTEIQPNDWLLAWIVNDEVKGKNLRERVLSVKACNSFTDGLKFVGRVQSIRKHLQQSPAGTRTVRYQLQGAGFKELDATIFYDPALSKADQGIGQFLAELGVGLDEICRDDSKDSGGISTTKVIPRLLKLLLGEGVPPASATLGEVQIATGTTHTEQAPYAYAIPKSVVQLLGQTQETRSVPSYADILELLIGVQKYTQGGSDPEHIFSPDGADGSPTNFRVLNKKLLGTFAPLPISLSGKSVWSILEEFKNAAVNEMYTALRLNAEGRVVPTLVVRQLAYSSEFALQNTDDESSLTGLLELPRWVGAPILVNSLDIGKSDAIHANFVHVYGQAASDDNSIDLTAQIINNPPIRDDQDIKRNGLRPHMMTVACSLQDSLTEPKKWMQLAADFLIGSQYTLSGSINMIGIAAPICPGDAFEFDDTVYHIESVVHSCSIDVNGQRQFSTSLTLSHGMRSDSPSDATATRTDTAGLITTSEVNEEINMYSGVKTDDNLGYDPGVTVFGDGEPQFSDSKFGDRTGDGISTPTDDGQVA